MDKVLDRLRDRVIDRGLWRARPREKSAPDLVALAAAAATATANSDAAAASPSHHSTTNKRLLYDYVDRNAIERYTKFIFLSSFLPSAFWVALS